MAIWRYIFEEIQNNDIKARIPFIVIWEEFPFFLLRNFFLQHSNIFAQMVVSAHDIMSRIKRNIILTLYSCILGSIFLEKNYSNITQVFMVMLFVTPITQKMNNTLTIVKQLQKSFGDPMMHWWMQLTLRLSFHE